MEAVLVLKEGDRGPITPNLGTSKKIIDETKRMIDLCAPGGGFVMDYSIVMDHYKKENMDTWFQTTMEYGKY